MTKKNKITTIFIIILLAIFFLQAAASMEKKSLIFDEKSHIPAGYSYMKTFDFRMNIEHPPLIKMISAVPLLFINPSLPLQDETWQRAEQWEFGDKFLFDYNKEKLEQITFWARVPIVLLGIILGIFVFLWARDLYGEKAGLLALFLYSFSPNILAHTRFVTTDIGVTLFIFVSCYYFHRFLEQNHRSDMIKCGISVGLALGAKYTGLYLIPIFMLLLAGFLIIEKKTGIKGLFKKKRINLYVLIIGIFIIALVVLALIYGIIGFPTYFEGLGEVKAHSIGGHYNFLMGEYSQDGWWYYFIVAFFIKTPIATIAMLFLSLIFFRKLKNEKSAAELFLVMPIIIYFLLFAFNNINIGLRHILPVYPFLFVFASKTAKLKNMWKYLVILLCIWYVITSFMIFPNYLAYFNGIIGGPMNGRDYLIDSNIDWSQDLIQLREYMEENQIDNMTIGAFSSYDIGYYGIEYEKLMCYPTSGLIAVSANYYNGFKEEDRECLDWLRDKRPIDHVGYSIMIYDIKEDYNQTQEAESYCKRECTIKCENQGMFFNSSESISGKCRCTCSET